jgi:RNA polymerase sigma-70 factor (ECF subfamily)
MMGAHRPTPSYPISLRNADDRVTTPQAFAELVRPHLESLYRLAYRLTGTVADAEDLLQDVLCKLYERRDELAAIESLGPWLKRVLHHRFVDGTRRRARQRLVLVGSAESERAAFEASFPPVAPPDAGSAFDVTRLAAALAQLSVEHRTVLLMHDAEGYKLVEIQEITGIELGTLKSRLHRARARLRELLGDVGTF